MSEAKPNFLRKFVRDFVGRCPVRVRRGLSRGAWWSLYPHSAYWRLGGNDSNVEAVLREHAARAGNTVWDVGAHYGIYAVGLARAVGPSGRVDAFEPDPVSLRRLSWHRRLNRLAHLHLHPVAASDEEGVARLFQYDDFGEPTSHLPYENETTANVPSREIQKIRLDDYLRASHVASPNFVKIDVEGHGGPALAGMRQTLETARPKLLIAIHSPAEHNAVESILRDARYDFQRLGDTLAWERHFGELLALPLP